MPSLKLGGEPSWMPRADHLALYYYESCPYCARVLRILEQLDVKLELRHVLQHPQYRRELVEARGRGTVPVLKITQPDGSHRWMPESEDIVDYLRERFS